MKRQLLLSLAATLLALPALARDFTFTYEGQTLTYTVINEEAKTCKVKAGTWSSPGNNVSGDLTIPDIADVYSVTSIGNYAFFCCIGLTSVTIPNSVTSIGKLAFNSCHGLPLIEIPGSVKEIDTGAFAHCDKLEAIKVDSSNPYFKSIDGVLFDSAATTLIQFPKGKAEKEYTIPNSVNSIGNEAFYDCIGLTSVTIPNSVTSIGGSAFWHCSGLTSVTLPNSVTSIGDYAFDSCSGLPLIEIPGSVKEIGVGAFRSCDKLKAIKVDSNNPYFKSIDGVLFDSTAATLIRYPGGKAEKEYIIPNSVNSIGNDAFYDCSGLTSVTIPNSVTSIGYYAFCQCIGLTSVTIPNSVTSIGYDAFTYCYDLTSITSLALTPPNCKYYDIVRNYDDVIL